MRDSRKSGAAFGALGIGLAPLSYPSRYSCGMEATPAVSMIWKPACNGVCCLLSAVWCLLFVVCCALFVFFSCIRIPEIKLSHIFFIFRGKAFGGVHEYYVMVSRLLPPCLSCFIPSSGPTHCSSNGWVGGIFSEEEMPWCSPGRGTSWTKLLFG